MLRSRLPLLLLVTVCATGLLVSGCDPKRVVGDGGSTGGTGSDPDFQVQPEAHAVTAILALHTEIMRASLGRSGDYDSSPGAPIGRGLQAASCVGVTQYSAAPAWEIRFDTCVDHNGTELRGGGQTHPLEGVDGFYFFPYVNIEDMLIATNASDQSFNHAYYSGTLEFEFQRNGSSVVDGVVITKFLRHRRGEEVIQFSYPNFEWTGTHGDWSGWPKNGTIANGVWDSVSGPFEIEFSGQSTVTFTLAGIPYVADLASGSVVINEQ